MMEPYNLTARCPKCGCDDIKSNYCDGRYCELKLSSLDPHRWDHIHRVCQRCHYLWPEAPIAALAQQQEAR
jgi:hypothetical protein